VNEWVWQGSSILLNVSKWQHTLLLKLAVMINTEYKMDKISGDRCTPLALSHISIVWFTLVFIIFLSQNHSYSLENWPWTLWLREASVERRWINQWSQERFVPHVNIAGPYPRGKEAVEYGYSGWLLADFSFSTHSQPTSILNQLEEVNLSKVHCTHHHMKPICTINVC
jgi:hypothetical protein